MKSDRIIDRRSSRRRGARGEEFEIDIVLRCAAAPLRDNLPKPDPSTP